MTIETPGQEQHTARARQYEKKTEGSVPVFTGDQPEEHFWDKAFRVGPSDAKSLMADPMTGHWYAPVEWTEDFRELVRKAISKELGEAPPVLTDVMAKGGGTIRWREYLNAARRLVQRLEAEHGFGQHINTTTSASFVQCHRCQSRILHGEHHMYQGHRPLCKQCALDGSEAEQAAIKRVSPPRGRPRGK